MPCLPRPSLARPITPRNQTIEACVPNLTCSTIDQHEPSLSPGLSTLPRLLLASIHIYSSQRLATMPYGIASRLFPSIGVKPQGSVHASPTPPPTPSVSQSQRSRPMLGGKGVIGGGKEKHGLGGKGLGKGGMKRHR